jgi:aspartyl-tRNA synthetase
MKRIFTTDTVDKVGETVKVAGWIHARRDMGKVMFFDLRDKNSLLQIVGVPSDLGEESTEIAKALRNEWVVEIEGVVQSRGAKQVNDKLATGTVEVLATKIIVLNESKTPPFEIDKDTSDINEELRLKYRYLDLRTERLQLNMKAKSTLMRHLRSFLHDKEFIDIETPLLTKATPEGARDFIVPSRMQPGKFFALPQSPQQYKQLLMVAGFERYFQFARCLRDEDPRADRGFEFTQLDIEMSFVEREDVMQMNEAMMIDMAENMGMKVKEKPFPRFTYKEAMEKYGADKFDLRTDEEKEAGDVFAFAWVTDFPFFEQDGKGGWTFTHNPFSQPLPESLEDHKAGKNIEGILTSQYDMVCNGFELSGGSIRAHDPAVLRATYKNMGYSDEETQESVGHMLEAFEFGAPPHGGIAYGIDRMLMILTNEDNIREAQAFPLTGHATASVMDAPSSLPFEALDEANIKLNEDAVEALKGGE